jgi:TetR/AcrR family transcriptional regulator, regulator of autoinduction and epiphytic fitness
MPPMTEATTGKPSLKARQRQLREDAILDAARVLLAQKGFTAMTLEDVIAEVGIAKPTLYQHFPSKEALGVSALQKTLRDMHDHLQALAASLPPAQALRAMIAWAIDQHFGPDRSYNFTGALSLFADASLRSAEHDLVSTFAALVADGQQDGSVKTTVAPRLIAQTFLSILKDTTNAYDFSDHLSLLPVIQTEIAQLLLGEV